MLVGRDQERAAIETILEGARSGVSGTLALIGEPGIGKTVLLEHAAGRAAATGMRVLRARGVESEAQVPFAALLELLRPALSLLDRIPDPQAAALSQALALQPGGQSSERFAVGAATLSVLSAYAEAGPLAVIIDDVHWIDRPSAEAMLFAVRRLVADPIASLLAARDGEPSLLDGADIRSLQLGGLKGDEIAELLGDVAPATTARLRRATGGNPLALQMLARAAAALGMEIEELGAAEAAGLVRLGGGNVEFRHPLVRSAVLAIRLAGASDRRAELAFALSGIAWLQARQGRTEQCRAAVREALEVCRGPATRFCELWTTVALADLELSLGNAAGAAAQLERQGRLIEELGLGDVDLWPAAELVESYLRLGRVEEAGRLSADYLQAATAKGQPWSLARAHRCQGLTATDGTFVEGFEQALAHHALTPDTFEMARTRLAYGERLRRSRDRVLAREQLREAERLFDRLGARPWANRARAELEATGERLRRGEPNTIDELTARELQIATLLASGRTTREAAESLFLSPKTVEYHLRHVYLKLDIHSRAELVETVAGQTQQA